MRTTRAALFGVLLVAAPLASLQAAVLAAPPPRTGAPAARLPQAAPAPGAPQGARATPAARPSLSRLERQARDLKRRMWRLRMRRRQFLAQGMPAHAHRVHERLIALGWQLRRVQAAERALTAHGGPMSPRR